MADSLKDNCIYFIHSAHVLNEAEITNAPAFSFNHLHVPKSAVEQMKVF